MAAATSIGFGALLRRLRLAAGLTQAALAERAGVSTRAISDLERDPARLPRLDSVALIADALALAPAERARFIAAARPAATTPPVAAEGHPAQIPSAPPPLPRPLTPLIGRASERATLAKLLHEGATRLLTLTGPGGIGKTRLAIAVATDAAATFADGVVFVDLSALPDPALVLATIARQIGLDERDPIPLGDRLIAALRDRHLLLLLDNLEHLVAARHDLLVLLAGCPRLTILATSRVVLRVRGERDYRVAPLALPEPSVTPAALRESTAATLFLERAADAGTPIELTTENAHIVAQICHRLDGVPLALELAAAWTRLLSPAALLTHLGRRLALLVDGRDDLPARQRTMRDTIAWSYALLDADEQRLFARLCLFAGGCTPGAATAVGEAPLPRLAALAEKSFLRADTSGPAGTEDSRIVILETLREYGLERLEESGDAATWRERHATYYLALAEEAEPALGGPHGRIWRARLEREHDNLRAALRWAIERADGVIALRLVGALWPFWHERGHLSEGRRWLREALHLPAASTPDGEAARGQALIGAARLAIGQADHDEAAARCDQAVAHARTAGLNRALVAALNTRGIFAREDERYADAARDHAEASTLALATGNRPGLAAALVGRSYAATFAGDTARGNALAEQGLAIYREIGGTHGLAEALLGVMTQAVHLGEYDRVEQLGTEALAVSRDFGDTGQAAAALWTLGVAAHFQGDTRRAAACYEECLALRRARWEERNLLEPLAALAMIALAAGDTSPARARLDETFVILRRYPDRWARAMSLAQIGHVELTEGAVSKALELFIESADLMLAIGNPLYLPWCLEGLAGVAVAHEQWSLAAQCCGAADAQRARLGFPLPSIHPTGYAATQAALRAALDAPALAAATAAGNALRPEEIIDLSRAAASDEDSPHARASSAP